MPEGDGKRAAGGVPQTMALAQHARPFLRWAGGKQRFVLEHTRFFPENFNSYLEPFLGGGSVFFYLNRSQSRPFISRLGDVNKQLIRCYLEVKKNPDEVYDRLLTLQAGYSAAADKRAFYYEVRDNFNARLPRPDSAAFIFLNQTCWNGLFRVNGRGEFNVPYGAPRTEHVIPSRDELLSASSALQPAHLRATSWENTLAAAERGDFAFVDPPYYSDYLTDETKYAYDAFSLDDHERLASLLESLVKRGVQFVLTNSADQEMISLYQDHGFQAHVIGVPRSINSKTSDRGPVNELVVVPTNTHAATRRDRERAAALLDLEAMRLKRERNRRLGGGGCNGSE